MFANVPLNGSTGIVRGHASRMVTSALGTKASGGEKQSLPDLETLAAQLVRPRCRLQVQAKLHHICSCRCAHSDLSCGPLS